MQLHELDRTSFQISSGSGDCWRLRFMNPASDMEVVAQRGIKPKMLNSLM